MTKATNNLLHFANYKDISNWSVQYANEENLGFTKKYPMARIGSFLVKSRDVIEVQDDVEYKQVTIKINNGGVVPRNNGETIKGLNIGTKHQHVVHAGQFIMSKIDARNGAYGIVPKELEGAIVTNDFPVFDVDTEKIIPQFLVLVSTTEKFIEFARKCSSGTTNRKRIDIDAFLNQQIPLPSIEEQENLLFEIKKYHVDYLKIQNEIKRISDSIIPFVRSKLYLSSQNKEVLFANEKYLKLSFVHLNTIKRWDIWNLNNIFLLPKYPVCKLSNIIKLQSGKFLSKKDFAKGTYPVYGGNGITGHHKDYCFEGTHIIIGRVGEKCGNVHLVTGKYWVTDNALKVDLLSNNISYEFLELALSAIDLGKYRIVSAQPSISQTSILSLSIPIPDSNTQKRIVQSVNMKKNRIKSMKEQADLLLSEARNLFYRMVFDK